MPLPIWKGVLISGWPTGTPELPQHAPPPAPTAHLGVGGGSELFAGDPELYHVVI